MSFSLKVKQELAGLMPNARHCRIAELAAIVMESAEHLDDGSWAVVSENEVVLNRFIQLYHKLFGELPTCEATPMRRGRKQVIICILSETETQKLCELLKISGFGQLKAEAVICRQMCCKRAFLRGAFLANGSISDPEKDYHLEFVYRNEAPAKFVQSLISAFDIEAKIIGRKQYSVVYLKDSESIVDLLNITEAHVSLMELENIRILKEMRNTVNRRVNCEAANIEKTVKAAGRQIEDIVYIRDTIGFEALTEDLRTTAGLRLDYPESSLAELGRLHDKPVGRSGVNHRLQKLSDIAANIRNGKPIEL